MTDRHPSVGIDRLWVEPSTIVMDMATLVRARGASVDEVCGDMMIDARSVVPPWEDPVTLAVNAVIGLLPDPAARQRVKLLLVASESGPDQEKALSTWVQRHAGLPDDVDRSFRCARRRGAVDDDGRRAQQRGAGCKGVSSRDQQLRLP